MLQIALQSDSNAIRYELWKEKHFDNWIFMEKSKFWLLSAVLDLFLCGLLILKFIEKKPDVLVMKWFFDKKKAQN